MSSPYLGLGLIAQCENNPLKAEQYLRKALGQRYSAAGLGAMKQVQAANPPSQNQGSQPRPLTDEKGNPEGVEVPDLPVYENIGRMVGQGQPIKRYLSGLDARKRQLTSDLLSVSEQIRKQQLRTSTESGCKDHGKQFEPAGTAYAHNHTTDGTIATSSGRADCTPQEA